jgi:hypothetical protein
VIPDAFRIVNAKDIVPHLPMCGTVNLTVEPYSSCPVYSAAAYCTGSSPPICYEYGGCCAGENNSDPEGRCNGYNAFCAYHHGTEIWFPSGEYASPDIPCGYRECVGPPHGEDWSCSNRYSNSISCLSGGLLAVANCYSQADHKGYWNAVLVGLCGTNASEAGD